jgi:hypothetical protein
MTLSLAPWQSWHRQRSAPRLGAFEACVLQTAILQIDVAPARVERIRFNNEITDKASAV